MESKTVRMFPNHRTHHRPTLGRRPPEYIHSSMSAPPLQSLIEVNHDQLPPLRSREGTRGTHYAMNHCPLFRMYTQHVLTSLPPFGCQLVGSPIGLTLILQSLVGGRRSDNLYPYLTSVDGTGGVDSINVTQVGYVTLLLGDHIQPLDSSPLSRTFPFPFQY